MTQEEKRLFLIRELLKERADGAAVEIPEGEAGQRRLLRGLFNIRKPVPADGAFLEIQDEYLQEELKNKGITDIEDLTPVQNGIYLWQGDITTLRCGAIVNAANSSLLGCFVPCHGCIDNAIHTYAGVQLRMACRDIMERQGHPEETGRAKLTPAFNLPCGYILHTVGPIVYGRLTLVEEEQLRSCYRSCLKLAQENNIGSLAFCCISTGEFRFPPARAAEIAIETVMEHRPNGLEVIFNVFKDSDYQIYRELLGAEG